MISKLFTDDDEVKKTKTKIRVMVKVTQKEFEAVSFFSAEVGDLVEGATDELFLKSIETCQGHVKDFSNRMFASKTKRIELFEHELDSFRTLRHDAAGKLDACEDEGYVADFESHVKQLNKLRKKFENAQSKANVVWAVKKAKEVLAAQKERENNL
ncbi:hypothetical protein A7M79_00440 [Acinetobacter baumannii]|uniref:hypothetical protein n=1 Tax=Acinetobacter baumannii TaxID=470 RepID=UPI0008DDA07A|nr:hypothetical protein [Acinetobacter baumannii]OIH11992.1 hypothetical protein A7M79_00440 [Acinetobacter baumannii]